jgi:hypothetical protein
LQRFLVADIETILNEKKEHVAYAVTAITTAFVQVKEQCSV